MDYLSTKIADSEVHRSSFLPVNLRRGGMLALSFALL